MNGRYVAVLDLYSPLDQAAASEIAHVPRQLEYRIVTLHRLEKAHVSAFVTDLRDIWARRLYSL